jgi:hypothetical protein
VHVFGDGHADGVVQAAAAAGHPVQEVMRAAAGVGADQHPAARPAGQLDQCQRDTSICSLAVFDPALPARSGKPRTSPDPAPPWSAKEVRG